MTPEKVQELVNNSTGVDDFARQVEAHTREECAKACENLTLDLGIFSHMNVVTPINFQCAQAIRSMQ